MMRLIPLSSVLKIAALLPLTCFTVNLARAELPKTTNSPNTDQAKPFIVLAVDKKTSSLKVLEVTDTKQTILRSYHATLGLVPGDKESEGDKKTPEGIYFFEEFRKPPTLEKKFGPVALTTNYPNSFDRFSRHTGSGIWLHSTDDPTRLTKKFDSLGCVVIKDDEITALAKEINYKTTPIGIYDDFDLNAANTTPERMTELRNLVNNWAKSWSSKNLESYISFYHPKFTDEGKNLKAWREHKALLNKMYSEIDVKVTNLSVWTHPKYDVAVFNQIYDSKFPNGRAGRQTSGIKILYLVKENGVPKILSEQFRSGKK